MDNWIKIYVILYIVYRLYIGGVDDDFNEEKKSSVGHWVNSANI